MLVSHIVLSRSSIDRPLKFLRSLVITRVSATYIRAYICARTHNARIRFVEKPEISFTVAIAVARTGEFDYAQTSIRGRSERVRLRFYYRVHRARGMGRRFVYDINREATRAPFHYRRYIVKVARVDRGNLSRNVAAA